MAAVEKLKFDGKYLVLAVIAAVLVYLAYFLKLLNSYSILIGIIFLAAFIINFNRKEGVRVLAYLMLFNILIDPLNMYVLKTSIATKVIILAINVAVLSLMIWGLVSLKKWGFYLAIIVLLFSSTNLVLFFVRVLKNNLASAVSVILTYAANAISLLVVIAALIYIIKSRKYFK